MRNSYVSLGWFSIGLGAAEIVFPRAICRWLGVKPHPVLLRVLGLREITSGMGLLSGQDTAGWLWSRVAGDAMDLALLGAASRSWQASVWRVAATGAGVAAVTAADLSYAVRETGDRIRVRESIAVNVPPEAAYEFWHDPENLPRFMRHLESVRRIDERRSHWVAKGPAEMKFGWDSEITEDRPNRLLAWRSLPGADVQSGGKAEFQPGLEGHGTLVRVEMEYVPPGGALGAAVAMIFDRDASGKLRDDLRRFRQLLEIGEIITTEGQPAGRRRSTSRLYDVVTDGQREEGRTAERQKEPSGQEMPEREEVLR